MQIKKYCLLIIALFVVSFLTAQSHQDDLVATERLSLEKYAKQETAALVKKYDLNKEQSAKIYKLLHRKGEKLQIIEKMRSKDMTLFKNKQQSTIIHARTGLKTIMTQKQYYQYSRDLRLKGSR